MASGIVVCRELFGTGVGNFPMQHEVMRRLFRMLWAGNAEAACEYLEGLGEERVKCRAPRGARAPP